MSPPVPRTGAGDDDAAGRPLLVTADPDLLDDLLALAAVAGVDVQVAPDLAAAGPGWPPTRTVLLGADACSAEAAVPLPVPPGAAVAMVGSAGQPPDPARAAALGVPAWLLPHDRAEVAALLAPVTPAAAPVLAVVGGRGGAGASTLACALAVTAAVAGRPVALVDADPLGGGIDFLLGGEQEPGLRWRDLAGLHGPVLAEQLAAALPRVNGVTLLSHDRGAPVTVPAPAMDAAVGALAGGHELVVVDLARADEPGRAAALAHVHRALLLVPCEVRSVVAAGQVAARIGPQVPDLQLVVRGPSRSGLRAGTVAATLGLPLVAWLRTESRLARGSEHGDPPGGSGRGPLADLCRALLRDLDAAAAPRVAA